MVDTHTHIYMPEFDVEGQAPGSMQGQCETADRALAAGVSMMIMPNVDLASIAPMRALHTLRPECTRMAMGLHPTEVKESWRDDLAVMMAELDSHPGDYIAIGEVGIDLYWDRTFEREQMEAFDAQAARAVALGLPLIIHCREGLEQTLEVLQGHKGIRAVMHSFGGTAADVELIRRTADLYFGINGIVTFKKSTLPEVLPAIGIDRIVTETDSPYLAPVPHRGTRNESAYVADVLARVALTLDLDTDEADSITTANARNLFAF